MTRPLRLLLSALLFRSGSVRDGAMDTSAVDPGAARSWVAKEPENATLLIHVGFPVLYRSVHIPSPAVCSRGLVRKTKELPI